MVQDKIQQTGYLIFPHLSLETTNLPYDIKYHQIFYGQGPVHQTLRSKNANAVRDVLFSFDNFGI